MSALRCPYCHLSVTARVTAVCSRCRAVAHPACAIELGRCGACAGPILSLGGLQAEGWQRVYAGVGEERDVAFLGACTREPPASELPSADPVSVQLDLARRREEEGGVLAGEAVLSVPAPTVLGALTLELSEETLRPGLFGVRSRVRPVRRVRLLGAASQGSAWRALFGLKTVTGIYAPGTYVIPFRLPLGDVLPTVDLPGASEQRRLRLTLCLERRRGTFQAALEVVVAGRPSQADADRDEGPLLARA